MSITRYLCNSKDSPETKSVHENGSVRGAYTGYPERQVIENKQVLL